MSRKPDPTPGKFFSLYYRKEDQVVYCRVEYNDANGLRHATRFELKVNPESESDCKLLLTEADTVSSEIIRDVQNDRELNEDRMKKVGKKDAKAVCADFIQRFAHVRWYFNLWLIYDKAQSISKDHIELDKFKKLAEKYRAMYETAWGEYFDYMTPYTRRFLDAKISEIKSRIFGDRTTYGRGFGVIERELGNNLSDNARKVINLQRSATLGGAILRGELGESTEGMQSGDSGNDD